MKEVPIYLSFANRTTLVLLMSADLLEFCQSYKLGIANTPFKHHPHHLYTWTSPDRGAQNQIGYIIINQK